MQQSEMDVLERYEDGFEGRCWTFLKVNEMGAWCDEMGEIGRDVFEAYKESAKGC
jgi:hypothetical protein